MKLRTFITPGDMVELLADLSPPDEGNVMMVKTGARVNGKQVAMGQLAITALDGEA
jgi:hypothetical protein